MGENCSGPWGGGVRGSWERGRHFGGRGPWAPRKGQSASVDSGQGRRKDIAR
jgi:hypothetical protein